MTEDEAKTKWCPKASTDGGDSVSVNRVYGSSKADTDCMCLASDCMFWRWDVDWDKEKGEMAELKTQGNCGMVR